MDDSNFRFCFTLDTEPDNLWEFNTTNSFEHCRVLPEFHRRMRDVGAKLSYLTTSEVAEDDLGRRALQDIMGQGGAEIGAHYHTWTRQWPFEVPELRNPPVFAMAHQLGQPIEERMLRYTIDALETNLNVNPKVYRGGRWSFNEQTPKSLINCGIEVDSTVTPGLKWPDASHPLTEGPDWTGHDSHPSFYRDEASQRTLVEIPMGSVNFASAIADRLDPAGVPLRVIRKLYGVAGVPFGVRWLRPTSMSVADMELVLRQLKADEVPVWVMMIHSSEVMPCKPLPIQSDVDEFINRCESICEIAQSLGASAATLEEAGHWILQHQKS